MRNISFFLTQDQFRNRTKTVTRRLGWKTLTPGTLLCGVVKGQGLKPGEQIERLGVIRVVSVRRERLDAIGEKYPNFGCHECAREGFPEMVGWEFVVMFGKHMKCPPETEITRIEFEYADDVPVPGSAPLFSEVTP